MMTRPLIALVCMAAFAACNSLPIPGQTAAPQAVPVFQALARGGAPVLQVLSTKTGSNSALVLEATRDGVQSWVSPDGAMLAIKDGFLVSTRGLGGDMLGSDLSESAARVLAISPGRVTRLHSFLDGENRVSRRAYVCDITRQADGEVTLGDRNVPARVMVEDCASADQRFLNLYWLNSQGDIIQSRQWAGDFAGALTFRIVP